MDEGMTQRKNVQVPRTSSMVDTGSIFSPLVLDLQADVPKPVGFLNDCHFLVGWLEFKLFLQHSNRVNQKTVI